MGSANFIKNRFLGKEICVTLLDGEAETLSYDQSTSSNREFFRGVVKEVDDDVIVLYVENYGCVYISEGFVRCFWEPHFEYYKAICASITKKPIGVPRR